MYTVVLLAALAGGGDAPQCVGHHPSYYPSCTSGGTYWSSCSGSYIGGSSYHGPCTGSLAPVYGSSGYYHGSSSCSGSYLYHGSYSGYPSGTVISSRVIDCDPCGQRIYGGSTLSSSTAPPYILPGTGGMHGEYVYPYGGGVVPGGIIRDGAPAGKGEHLKTPPKLIGPEKKEGGAQPNPETKPKIDAPPAKPGDDAPPAKIGGTPPTDTNKAGTGVQPAVDDAKPKADDAKPKAKDAEPKRVPDDQTRAPRYLPAAPYVGTVIELPPTIIVQREDRP